MLFAFCLRLNARKRGVSLAHLLSHSLTLVNLRLPASPPRVVKGFLEPVAVEEPFHLPLPQHRLPFGCFNINLKTFVHTGAECFSLSLCSFSELENLGIKN